MGSITNEFSRDLDESYRIADLPFWEEVYRKLWPEFEDVFYHPKDTPEQLSGIDRTLVLPEGPSVQIDEKVRTRNKITGQVYKDIALEIYSDKDKQTEGWITKETAAHFLNYVILPRGEAYIFYIPILQEAWRIAGEEWQFSHGHIYPRNVEQGQHWSSDCCPVPPHEIFEVMDSIQVGNYWVVPFDVPEGEDKEEGHE